MCMCHKCMATTGILLLIIGILFLLVDVGVWAFWNLQWYTVVFLLFGLITLVSGSCKDCRAVRRKK